MKRALFLDRDGTLIQPRRQPSDPGDLVLSQGVCPLLRTFQQAGWEVILVANDSGIASGSVTGEMLDRLHDRLRDMLGVWGIELNAIQSCSHRVDAVVPHVAIPCRCRKPRPGMLLRAADTRDIDLRRSWMIGDDLYDVEAGNRAGCRTVLVDLGTEPAPDRPERRPALVAGTTADALRAIAFAEGLLPLSAPPPRYRPAQWMAYAGARR